MVLVHAAGSPDTGDKTQTAAANSGRVRKFAQPKHCWPGGISDETGSGDCGCRLYMLPFSCVCMRRGNFPGTVFNLTGFKSVIACCYFCCQKPGLVSLTTFSPCNPDSQMAKSRSQISLMSSNLLSRVCARQIPVLVSEWFLAHATTTSELFLATLSRCSSSLFSFSQKKNFCGISQVERSERKWNHDFELCGPRADS